MSSPGPLNNPAICTNLCQVTSGREPQWAATATAQWIKAELENRGKNLKWLSQQIAKRHAKEQSPANPDNVLKTVIGWTRHGRTPSRRSRDDLQAVFGKPLPEQHEWIAAQLLDLQRRLDALEASPPQASPARRP